MILEAELCFLSQPGELQKMRSDRLKQQKHLLFRSNHKWDSSVPLPSWYTATAAAFSSDETSAVSLYLSLASLNKGTGSCRIKRFEIRSGDIMTLHVLLAWEPLCVEAN